MEEKIKVKEIIEIPEGKHNGVIDDVVRREVESDKGIFDYTDIHIDLVDLKDTPTIKMGFPTTISELSTLGQFLKSSGMDFKTNDEFTIIDILSHLKGKKLSFQTYNDSNHFAVIVKDTVKFVK